jgi:exodeoxyribonuclease VII large subunit
MIRCVERLPFNPEHVAGPQPDPRRPARRDHQRFSNVVEASQLTVSQACELIKGTLESRVPSPLRIIGQISNLRADGHWYFSLKDASAVLHCVSWATNARKFEFKPKDGDEVVATGHVSHFAPQGRTQLYVTGLQPVGAGALELKFRAMCEELRALGYFDDARKKPLPLLPRRIAVITSSGGAAIHDVLDTARRRCMAVGIVIIDVRVQGEGAADQVARAIRWIDSQHARLGVDAILVTRGGGSAEDLWAFNERIVADAAHECSIPLVAAIGHESDTTVIELVADVRAATPTQAAMRLIPARSELLALVRHHDHRLTVLVRRGVERSRERLNALARQEMFRDPLAVWNRAARSLVASAQRLQHVMRASLLTRRSAVDALAAFLADHRPQIRAAASVNRLAVLEDRLKRVLRARLDFLRETEKHLRRRLAVGGIRLVQSSSSQIDSLERNLACIDPHSVLGRGYSYTQDDRGRLVRSIRDVRSGQRITTRVSDGSIDSTVGAAQPRRLRTSSDSPAQMDLFDLLQ